MISLTNLDTDADHTVAYDLRGGNPSDVSARILHADSPQGHNTREALDAVAPAPYDGVSLSQNILTVTMPAHSFVTVRFVTGRTHTSESEEQR